MNVLVFDIETIPDVESGRRLYELDGLSDADVAKVMFHKRREETGDSEFLRHPLHRVVAISAVLRHDNTLKVWSLGDESSTEPEIVRRFFDGIERYTPTLVSWNGSGFDLPVLHYRALKHGIAAPRYWDTGEDERDFKWNNYLSRFHERHTDLMDVLAGYQPRASAALDDIARMIGLPGKLGMHGSQVWDAFRGGRIADIRAYCETDVINTWLIWLRFQLIRGRLEAHAYEAEMARTCEYLASENKAHFNAYLAAWRAPGS